MGAAGRAKSIVGAVACAAAVLGAMSAAPGAEQPETSWKRESARWLEEIGAGGEVRVVNPVGDVYARFGGYESKVEVLATSQYVEGTRRPEVSVSHEGAGLRIESRGATAAAATPAAGRVDLVVFVPEGAALDVETVDGRIEIKGLHGDVSADSLKGDIAVRSVRGHVDAKSARGTISATLENGATDRRQTLATETGDIEVWLWEDADQKVRIATSGEISTDFSIDIEHLRFAEPGKRAVATVGRGGPELVLESKRGHIRLLRLQKDFTPGDEAPEER